MDEYVRGIFVGKREDAPAGGDWVRIKRGVYLDRLECEAETFWEYNRLATVARQIAVTLTRRQAQWEPVFTGEAALIAHGYPTWLGAPEIIAWRSDGRRVQTSTELEKVSFADFEVPAVTCTTLDGRRCGSTNMSVSHILTVDPIEAVVDIVRRGHPAQALTAMSALMAKHSNFTNFNQALSRPLAEETRQLFKIFADELVRYRARLLAIVEVADPGVVGPGEAAVRWILAAITDITAVITQFPVSFGNRRFFLDAAIPEKKCCFEFDGTTKSRDSESQLSFTERQRYLTNAGWKVFRVTWPMVKSILKTARDIAQFLAANDIAVHAPKRELWVPLPSELLVPARW
ncbi:hypothetical protein FYJ24_09870 [Actinomycetaceae bacterium WB03_NA08]|uniref:DUF559 domain-containing protein n=1 Tax=Scrofimicrobium canadense TaxID=2652290 RepID=A0A6N7W9B8_9ACTO|nr:hypothetical protein [Scrofimicrobium canadense]MSS85063.1 hypothetical protein [Scrofimicrobium canadense]